MSAQESPSTRPYLVRALYEWCTDNGFTPYVAVMVDETVQVPREYVQDGEIVLNVSFDATSSLKLSNEFIEFKARFGGKAREIMVPMNRVMAIYARENGQGMAFPVNRAERVLESSAGLAVAASTGPAPATAESIAESDPPSVLAAVPKAQEPESVPPTPITSAARPTLTRIK
jgi:stringent starvation protein B